MRETTKANPEPHFDEPSRMWDEMPMRTEHMNLAGAITLGFLHIGLASLASTRQRGASWNLSSRGGNPPPLTGAAARLNRASENFKETFPFFLAALVLVGWAGRFGAQSALGSTIYLGSRALYLPIYAFDVIYVRSALWLVSLGGIALILGQFIL